MFEIEIQFENGNVVSVLSSTREEALTQLRRVWTPQVKTARVWRGTVEVYCYQK